MLIVFLSASDILKQFNYEFNIKNRFFKTMSNYYDENTMKELNFLL